MGIEVATIPSEFDRYSQQADLLQVCHDTPLVGYPKPEKRWHISSDKWDNMAKTGEITVPAGDWVVSDHPARQKETALGIPLQPEDPNEISVAQKEAWRAEYALVTDQGLPVHPSARMGVTTEILSEAGVLHKLGMAAGIGRERRYGALNTGALLLARLGLDGEIEYPVVTELRNKKLRCSFPGGYAEIGELIVATCIREASEELGIVDATERTGVPWGMVQELPCKLWRVSPSITGPCTLNAWLAENFLAIDATSVLDMQGVNLEAGESGVKNVKWRPGRELAADPIFIGSHRRALLAHMSILDTR